MVKLLFVLDENSQRGTKRLPGNYLIMIADEGKVETSIPTNYILFLFCYITISFLFS